jgi:hypothetical protein
MRRIPSNSYVPAALCFVVVLVATSLSALERAVEPAAVAIAKQGILAQAFHCKEQYGVLGRTDNLPYAVPVAACHLAVGQILSVNASQLEGK